MTGGAWASLASITVVAGEGFTLTLDFAGERIETPLIPAQQGTRLAFALLALGAVDDRAAVQLPYFGSIRLGNLKEAGSMLLAYYPGPVATDGIAALLGIMT